MIQRLSSAAASALLSSLVPVLVLALASVLGLLLGSAHAARADQCLAVKGGTAREIGQFRPGGGEKSYCVYARAGQTMRVTIKPLAPDLATQGHIVFPSHQEDGGPGGVIFDQKLSEEGRYEIFVGRRFEKKPGAFELSVELR